MRTYRFPPSVSGPTTSTATLSIGTPTGTAALESESDLGDPFLPYRGHNSGKSLPCPSCTILSRSPDGDVAEFWKPQNVQNLQLLAWLQALHPICHWGPPSATFPLPLLAPSMPAEAHPNSGAETRTETTDHRLLWRTRPPFPTVAAAVPPTTVMLAVGLRPALGFVSTLPVGSCLRKYSPDA